MSDAEKLMWGRVNGLTGQEGFCFALNATLAENLGRVNKESVSNLLGRMAKRGLLCIVYELKKEGETPYLSTDSKAGGKMIQRRIYPTHSSMGPLPSIDGTPPIGLWGQGSRDSRVESSSVPNGTGPEAQDGDAKPNPNPKTQAQFRQNCFWLLRRVLGFEFMRDEGTDAAAVLGVVLNGKKHPIVKLRRLEAWIEGLEQLPIPQERGDEAFAWYRTLFTSEMEGTRE